MKLQSTMDFNNEYRQSFEPITSFSIKSSMSKRLLNKAKLNKPKIGELLLKKGIINGAQLEDALRFQKQQNLRLGESLVALNLVTPSDLKRALVKQSWLKLIGTVSAFVLAPLAPVTHCLAESQNQHTIEVASLDKPQPNFAENLNTSLIPISIKESAKAYYFSGHQTNALGDDVFFVLNSPLSKNAGLSISLFSNSSLEEERSFLRFDPQISLFKFSFKPNIFSFNKRKRLSNNRYTNTIPAVVMLTLKGRSIYESAGNQTKLWSLNRAKKGVQRKAQLMLSITKQF